MMISRDGKVIGWGMVEDSVEFWIVDEIVEVKVELEHLNFARCGGVGGVQCGCIPSGVEWEN
jgi:hypothetical protein